MNRDFFPRCSSANNYTARGMDCVSTVSRRRTNSDEEDEEEEDRALDDTIVATSTPVVAPFQYLISEQAKSIVALQELQNEVGALLEFRDLVMETFPHLRQKMSSTAPSTPRQLSHIPVATSLQGKSRDWEPGIRVRRKLHQHGREQDTSVPSMGPRSRSNSHGKAPKSSSGEAGNSGTSSTGSSAVQDSGFCTESKEHCSSSTSTTTTATATTSARKVEEDSEQEVEDELWNLLDIIHIKGTKLRLEVEYLQGKLEKTEGKRCLRRSRSLEYVKKNHDPPRTKCDLELENELRGLKQERDILLDRVADMEAENLSNLAQTNQLLAEMGALSAEKRELEEQLRAAISTKDELNSRIHDLHLQFVSRSGQDVKDGKLIHSPMANTKGGLKSSPSKSVSSSQIIVGSGSCFTPVGRMDNISVDRGIFGCESGLPKSELGLDYLKEEDGFRIEDRRPSDPVSRRLADSDTPKIAATSDVISFGGDNNLNKISNENIAIGLLGSDSNNETVHRLNRSPISDDAKTRFWKKSGKLGTLDGVLSSPNKIKGAKDILPDKKKTAAILMEFNAIELQRHLLTTTFENQVASHHLDKLSRLKADLSHQLEKFKEENDDLRFQLEEKSIELEGTRARIRLLERLQSAKFSSDLSESVVNHSHTLLPPSHESTPNPILPHIALPIALDDTAVHHSSSTESAHHDEDLTIEKRSESPRKKPSKIPLKSYSAPKPPSGRTKPVMQKSTKESISLGRSRDVNKPRDVSINSRSRESSAGGKTGSRESLKEPPSSIGRRIRKHSTQDGSFSSTGSSHSVRNPSTPSLASKKTQPPSSRDRISSQDQNEQKVRPTKLSFWSNWLRG